MHGNTRRVDATHRRMLMLALPMTISHMTTPLLGFVDAVVIGRLGDASLLGSVALAALLFDFLFWAFGALRMGTAGLTAQAYGAGNDREIEATLMRALAIAGIGGLALIVLQVPLGAMSFHLLGASETVTNAAYSYFAIRIWSAPVAFANYAILGSLVGRGRTDLGLAAQIVLNVANMALTAVLVLVFDMGVEGAAIGTSVAEVIGLGAGFLLLKRIGARPFAVPLAAVTDRVEIRRMLSINRDIAIRSIALLLAYACFTSYGARAGDVPLAANAILNNMFMIASYFLDGFGTAAEQLCGQAAGSRDERGFRRVVWLALFWSTIFGVAASILSFVGGLAFVDFVTTSEEVRTFARAYLPYAAIAPIVGAAAFTFDGIYTGATWTVPMRNLMAGSFVLFYLTLQVLSGLDNAGLWIAMLVFLGARSVGQALLYPRLTARMFPASRPTTAASEA